MTQILINNEKLNITPATDTLDELMSSLLDNHLEHSEVITSIAVDGKSLTLEEENNLMPKKVSDLSSINFTVKNSLELSYEALDSCSNYIEVVIEKIGLLNELFAKNETQAANALFSEVVEILDLFIQLMSKIHNTLKKNLGKKFIKTKTIQDLEIHLLSIVKALVPAKEKNDIIMLCDLLEYELVDNLTQWKIKAIPELKNMK